MSKEKGNKESSLRPEPSRELDQVKLADKKTEKLKRTSRPGEERFFEEVQKARIKEAQRKILKDEHYDKHKKADRKIGGVRGKFHPSLERTRKRT
jgi:hypothetical protein